MNDYQRLTLYVERFFAAAAGTAWPTVARAARALRWSHRRLEEACDGDPDGVLHLTGYNLCEERCGEPVLGQLYVERY